MDNVPLKDLFPNVKVRKRQVREKKTSNVESPQECTRSKLRESLATALKMCQNEEPEPGLMADELPYKRSKLGDSNRIEKDTATWNLLQNAENVAVDIEAELFKLFSASIKKYNEKARSLIFNLKDRTNPDLRARVLFGKISPESLCTMSAEQLASKELCQWRTAKAEELADMVVLTDAGAGRVVKKTHKGVFEVQIEKGNDVPVLNVSDLKRPSELKDGTSLKGISSKQEAQLNQVDIDALKEETDCLEFSPIRGSVSPNKLLEGLIDDKLEDMVEVNASDGLEKVLVLPTIMSPDEYFKSRKDEIDLDMKDQEKLESDMDRDNTKSIISSEIQHFNSLDGSKNHASLKVARTDNFEVIKTEGRRPGDMTQMEKQSYMEKDDKVWEGSFQLSGSQISPVLAFLRSGERTDLVSWPKMLEIKGRVRLDALDKFLQELHLSRTRSVMIISFQVDNELVNVIAVNAMKETAKQYEKGERVGFAEPVPGFELYLFPTRGAAIKLLFEHGYGRYEPDEHELLVGCIVWRRTQIPASVTYKSSNHYFNVNRHALSGQMDSPTHPDEAHSLEHDLPPGFGPKEATMSKPDGNVLATQDEDNDDDLPEFDFSAEIAQYHVPKVDVVNTPSFPNQDMFLHPQGPPYLQVQPPLSFSAFSAAEKTGASEQLDFLSNPHVPQFPPEKQFLDHGKSAPLVMSSLSRPQLHLQVPQFPGIMYPTQSPSFRQRQLSSNDGPGYGRPPVPLLFSDLSHHSKQDHGFFKDHLRSEDPYAHPSRHQNASVIERSRPQGHHVLFRNHTRPEGQHSFKEHPSQAPHGAITGQPRQAQHSLVQHGQPPSIPITCMPMSSASNFLAENANRGSQSHTTNIWVDDNDDDDDMPEWHPPPLMQSDSSVSSSIPIISSITVNSRQVAVSKQGSHGIMPAGRPWVNVQSVHQATPSQPFPSPVRHESVQASRFRSSRHQ